MLVLGIAALAIWTAPAGTALVVKDCGKVKGVPIHAHGVSCRAARRVYMCLSRAGTLIEMPRHPVPRYTFLAFQFNMLLDQGETLPIEEVQAKIEDGSLFGWLEDRYGKEPHFLDLSLYDVKERGTILASFQELLGVNADRKFGVTRNGISLCLAYCIEILQHPDDFAA